LPSTPTSNFSPPFPARSPASKPNPGDKSEREGQWQITAHPFFFISLDENKKRRRKVSERRRIWLDSAKKKGCWLIIGV
jgi:hypothetical protein